MFRENRRIGRGTTGKDAGDEGVVRLAFDHPDLAPWTLTVRLEPDGDADPLAYAFVLVAACLTGGAVNAAL